MKVHSDENNSETRARILQAAWDLASEQGYGAVTMRNVAKAANMGKSTLYRHYTTKEEVYRDVTVAWGKHFAQQLREQKLQGITVGERLCCIFSKVMKEAQDHPNLIASYVASLLSNTEDPHGSRNQLEMLTPGLIGLAVGNTACQPKNQQLAHSVLGHIMLSSMQLMSANLLTADRAAADINKTAELLLQDIWNKPCS